MLKGILLILLVTLAVSLQCNGTTGNYLSEHSLGQQDQINDTTTKICPKISIKNVANTYSQGNLSLSKITLKCIFYDGAQKAEAGTEKVTVTGGKIEFQVNFAVSLNSSGTLRNGTGYASVFSDGTNFTKLLTYGTGSNIRWLLAPDSLANITAKTDFTLKRYSIENATTAELQSIASALNNVTESVKQQILTQYNQNFSNILNQTLAEEQIFTFEFNYTYHHPSLGDLIIPFRNNISDFGLNKQDGLMLQFDTYIVGQTIDCQNNLTKHDDYKYFGGIQTVHSMQFYDHIFGYVMKKKWFDVNLNTDWNTNAFQFYAGDLFEIIPKVSSNVSPRTRLAGNCTAQNDDNFKFKRNGTEKYSAVVNYKCEIITETNVKVADFDILTTFILRAQLAYESIHLSILTATGTPTFRSRGEYVVTNFLLAQFKVNQVLKSLSGHKVIGDGFPSWPRDHPNLDVRTNYTLFYDSSHIPHLESL